MTAVTDAVEAAYREGAALGSSYGQHTTAEIVTAGWFTSQARARPAPAAEGGEVEQIVSDLEQSEKRYPAKEAADLIRRLVAERDEARRAWKILEGQWLLECKERDALAAQLARPAPVQGSEEERMAAELAPTLDLLLDAFLSSPGGDIPSEVRSTALKTFLWDNKVSILRILQARTIPRPQEGWQLVPKEPTQRMLDEVCSSDGIEPFTDKTMASIYREMIAAAPTPAETEAGGEEEESK